MARWKDDKKKPGETLKYYHYYQNNPGGRTLYDARNRPHVVVQAYSADEANKIAEECGLYFDGCDNGQDCSCCGDRWSRAWDDDGCDSLEKALGSSVPLTIMDEDFGITNVIIYMNDGEIKYTSDFSGYYNEQHTSSLRLGWLAQSPQG